MQCSSCGGDMEKGEAAVRGSWETLFFSSNPFKHLFFKGANKGPKEKQKILKSGHKASAYRCNSCGAVLVLNNGETANLVHW